MKITDSVTLPEESLASTITIVGRPGVGKTYAAKGIVEKLLAAKARTCIIDPTGAWWGLRASADGKGAGLQVVIFGGDHADCPITEDAGAALGQLVATQHMQCIVDLSSMTPRAQCVFVAEFLLAIYDHTDRQPLQLVIDEADEFAPQSPKSSEAVGSLEQVDRCARRGRIRGIRPMLITQRLAVLSKDVFSASWTLVSLGVSLPADRKAVKDWMEAKLDKDAAAELVDSLSKLKRGEGWVCYPPDEILERVHFPKIRTFDSSSSPTAGQNLKITTAAADLDLSAITAAMDAAIKQAEASDPKKLRARVEELEAEVSSLRAGASVVDSNPEILADNKLLMDRILRYEGELKEANAVASAAVEANAEIANAINRALRQFEETQTEMSILRTDLVAASDMRVPQASWTPPPSPEVSKYDTSIHSGLQPIRRAETATQNHAAAEHAVARPTRVVSAEPARAAAGREAETSRPTGGDGLSGPQARILAAIAFWQSVGVPKPTRTQVAVVAEYAPTSGSWRNRLAELRASEHLEYDGDHLILRHAGVVAIAAHPSWRKTITRRSELHTEIKVRLSEPQQRLLNVLLDASGRPVTRTELAERSGYEASSGSFRNRLGELRGLGLITYPNKTTAAAAPLLFPQGLR